VIGNGFWSNRKPRFFVQLNPLIKSGEQPPSLRPKLVSDLILWAGIKNTIATIAVWHGFEIALCDRDN
jgi:hypothetical protein